MKRGNVVFMVLDSVGIGALPDAHEYGDEGTNTVGNIARVVGGLHLPNLRALGLGNIVDANGVAPVTEARACFGKMAERSAGKDSTTGHWELAGVITEKAFPLYPNGFPPDVIGKFLAIAGCTAVLGNKPASGTDIIRELGEEHVRTGNPIVYTSGDSVFQIAAHEEVIPLERQYEICTRTRLEVMTGIHAVGRIIARPFIGKPGAFVRTTNRRDFALDPPATTLLDLLFEEGIETVGVGKIDDLFCGRGLRQKIHTKSNAEGLATTIDAARGLKQGFVMTNLVDFDMMYGHRQDPKGYGAALEEFDRGLPSLLEVLNEGDLLLLTADHGNDPTDNSTDHSREYVPLLCFVKGGLRNVNLGVRPTYADAAKTIAEYCSLKKISSLAGNSFLQMMV
ncbi:MAG TPA: phosphopentomutase [Bacteroidota bacterium]|nr:phosphopentomutase [Bacteroidota bacterium]